ncbi:MAG: DUF3617 domain-containing protein [Kangiellaceae bacterium]|nr:DUF3617 domain-containing protein [Kangiellaceae bacterium]
MKTSISLALLLVSINAYSDQKLTPLEMELGYWETTATMQGNDMMSKMLAQLPEAQRAQAQQMMGSQMKIPVVKQCITKDSFKDMEKQFKESMGSKNNDCKFEITKSTAKEFIGILNCASGQATKVHTTVVNSKLNRSDVLVDMGEMGKNKIVTVAKWISTTCPPGVN